MTSEYKALPPYNRCGAAVIAMLSLTERLACSVLGLPDSCRTFANWRLVLNHIRQYSGGHFKSNGVDCWPSDFLELNDKDRIGLTGRNLQTSLARLEKAVATALRAYLADTSPIKTLLASNMDIDNQVLDFIQKAVENFSNLIKEGQFILMTQKLSPVNMEHYILEGIIQNLFPNVEIPAHPLFRSVRLFDEFVVSSEFFSEVDGISGIGTEAHLMARGSFTLYAVLREARGWSPDNPADANIIVRDLLWIRNSMGPWSYSPADYDRKEKFLGLYIDAIDKRCSYVERLDMSGPEIILTARDNRNDTDAQILTFILPTSPRSHALQIRYGVMSGSAGLNRDLAAWKCLLIRPNWEFFDQLRTIMAAITPDDMGKLCNICADVSAVGVYFSKSLMERHAKLAEERRQTFRKVIASNQGSYVPESQYTVGHFLGEKVADGLSTLISAFYQSNNMKIISDGWEGLLLDLNDKIVNYINNISVEHRHLIEPAQIIDLNAKKPTQSAFDMPAYLLEQVELLLDLREIDQYKADYS